MKGNNKYASLADTIKIEDITANKINRGILHRIKGNDPTLIEIEIRKSETNYDSVVEYNNDIDYIVEDGEDIGWLGYFIGQNTSYKILLTSNQLMMNLLMKRYFITNQSNRQSYGGRHFNRRSYSLKTTTI